MKPIRLIVCLAALASSLPVLAAGPVAPPSGLAAALEQAWRLHPQAAGLAAREAEARAAQDVAAGLTPEPGSVSFGSIGDRFSRNQGKQEYEVELATPLWLPGQRAAREAEASSRIDEAGGRRAALRLELAGELRDAWWALAAARNANALAVRRLDTARALEADVRRRFTVGELSRIDANLAQSEVHVAGAELIESEATLLQAEQGLRTLTGTTAPEDVAEEAPTTLPGTSGNTKKGARLDFSETNEKGARLDFSEAQKSNLAPFSSPFSSAPFSFLAVPETHPVLVAAAAAARSARARVAVADESRRAAPELALRVVRERDDNNESYGNTVGIRLKIPFSSGAQVRRETSAAQAEADQADAEMLRTQTRVRLEAERAQRALSAAERQLFMAQERLALSAENLRLNEKAFSLGESDLATLLRIRAAAFDAESFLGRQRVARAAAISRLNQAMGVLP